MSAPPLHAGGYCCECRRPIRTDCREPIMSRLGGRCAACTDLVRQAVRWWAGVMMTEKGLPDWREPPADVSWLETTLGSGHHHAPAYALLDWALSPAAAVRLQPYVNALEDVLPRPPWPDMEGEWVALAFRHIEYRQLLDLRRRKEGLPA